MNNNQNSNQNINVVPNIPPINNNPNNIPNQYNGNFGQNMINNLGNQQNITQPENNDLNEINKMLKPTTKKFINENINTQDNSLNNLNIPNENGDLPRVDYSKDPKVIERLNQNENKKNTVTITSEGKIFIIIIVVLLLFIFVLPTIFDYVRNIMYP